MRGTVEGAPAIWKRITGLLLLLAAVLVFVSKDAFLYSDTIVKVMSVENTFAFSNQGPNEEEEQYYEQAIEGRILNGADIGAVISLSNTYSSSGVNDERYRKGDQLFVTISKGNGTGMIIGKKRDVYLVLLIGMFLFALFVINRWQGGIIFVSLIINIGIFLIALMCYGQGGNLIRISMLLMMVFSVLTLLFAGGFHKKTAVAIVSTLFTTLLCYFIYEIVLHTSDRLPYEMMDYVVNPTDLSDLFFAGVLMGSLGAIMDVCISIAAGVSEIMIQTPDIGRKPLVRSIREMGYDIMGTMINVLFFTYISGSLPILVIKIKNSYTLYHLIQFQSIFEIIRFLMGAIGIVLAIPVSGMCSVLILHSRRFEDGNMVKEQK